MKKKPLLFALLALAIVTSLTAGTLAVYTRSVTLDGDVQIKQFAFSATGGTQTYVEPVKLAPNHSDTTTFTVTNADTDGTLAEVDMDYKIVVDITQTEKTMKGLKAELINEKNETLKEGTQLEYTGTLLAGEKAVTDKYTVKLTWVDDGLSDGDQTTIGELAQTISKGLEISVTANQI